MNQKEAWDSIAEDWDKFRRKPLFGVVSFLEKNKGKILDMGCGTGRHVLEDENHEFYGIDFSDEMVKIAKKKKQKSKFFVSSLENLPFKDNFFDAAIYISVLHCLENKGKREKSLRELFRVLKSNSKARISVWSKKHPRISNLPGSSFVPWRVKSKNLKRYYYFYEKDELENLLKSVGFEVQFIEDDSRNIHAVVIKPRH